MIDICNRLYNLTKNYHKRLKIMEYLLNLAFIDKEFSNTEMMITEDISNALKIKIQDFNNLINTFKSFMLNKLQIKQLV